MQVHRPKHDPSKKREYVTVLGRSISTTANNKWESWWDQTGWIYVSRELPRRKAKVIAKAYRNAGFNSRVLLRDARGVTVTDTYNKKG